MGEHHLAVVDEPLAGTSPVEAAGILRKAALALPVAAQNQSSQPSQATIDNFAFTPKELTVKAGSTVDWTNKDDTPHTVTSDDGVFSSPLMDTNQKFQYTFQKPGRFPYHCKLHPMMTGAVVAQ
jgi:plastocyanin